jgi:hypothetical protein
MDRPSDWDVRSQKSEVRCVGLNRPNLPMAGVTSSK